MSSGKKKKKGNLSRYMYMYVALQGSLTVVRGGAEHAYNAGELYVAVLRHVVVSQSINI